MWLFTRFGMFSAVCARQGGGKGKSGKYGTVDPNTVMVRARDKRHLEELRKRFKELQPFAIVETSGSDYRFRLLCPKGTWAHVMCDLALDLDYGNFKNEAARSCGSGSEYVSALHRVWNVMYDLQSRKYGPGIYSRPSRVLADYGITADDPDLNVEDEPAERPVDSTTFSGGTPDADDIVVRVVEQDTGQEVGVIWWPDLFDTYEQAYEKSVEAGALRAVPHPEFVDCKWGTLKDGCSSPIFDVFDYGSLERNEEGDEELLLPFRDVPVIRLVD